MAEHSRRALLVTYEEQPDQPELLVDGITNDGNAMELHANVLGQESDAWLLYLIDVLPDWWPLVTSVHLRNLTRYADMDEDPRTDALDRLEGLSDRDLVEITYGWRVINTSGGGRIFRLRERKPALVPREMLVTIMKLPKKVLGPYEPLALVA